VLGEGMKRILISLIFLLSTPVMACTVPMMGEEFDRLIVVEKVGENAFKAFIPQKAKDLSYGASITVEYYPSGSKYRIGEYSKRVSLKEKGSNYVVDFDLKIIEGYTPFLQVFWFPKSGGLCGAYGKSSDLSLK